MAAPRARGALARHLRSLGPRGLRRRVCASAAGRAPACVPLVEASRLDARALRRLRDGRAAAFEEQWPDQYRAGIAKGKARVLQLESIRTQKITMTEILAARPAVLEWWNNIA